MHPQGKEKCLHLMMDILRTLTVASHPQEILSRTIDLIVRVLPCQSVAVVLIDPKSEYLRVECSHGLSHTFQKQFRQAISTGPIGDLVWNNRAIFIEDAGTDATRAAAVRLEYPFGSCVCVAISVNQRTLGYLYVDSVQAHAFESDDVLFLQTCADVSGIALHKYWLTEENLRLERFDGETGVEKFPAFRERLETAVERGVQFREPFAVVLIDVDNFKSIGNTYGYKTTRELLKGVAGIIRGSLRLIDVAGRFGFDEFVILRENIRADEAEEFADGIRSTIEQTPLTDHGINSTVSIGVALFPRHGKTGEELIVAAKKALFEAQKGGRNRVMTFPAIRYEPQDPSSVVSGHQSA